MRRPTYRPDTERKLEAVRDWQLGPFHELTCGVDSRHAPLAARVLVERVGEETAEHVILVCVERDCTYAQGWIPEPVLAAQAEAFRKFLDEKFPKYRAAAER